MAKEASDSIVSVMILMYDLFLILGEGSSGEDQSTNGTGGGQSSGSKGRSTLGNVF